MLLYISSNQNIGIFDFMIQEQGIIIKKLSGEFHMKKFVLQDMRNLTHCTHIAIDMGAVKDTEEDFLEAIRAFQTLYDSRIIIYKEDFVTGDNLVGKLIDEGVFNILTAKEVDGLKQQIIYCMSSDGMSYEDALALREGYRESKDRVKPKYLFPHKEVRIAITGTVNKIGVTTIAFNVCQYLSSIGASVSYTEANESGHLAALGEYYGFEEVGKKVYKYKKIEYYGNNMCAEGLDFNVVDFGVLQTASMPIISIFQVCMLCAGFRPYEKEQVENALLKLSKKQIDVIVAGADKEEQERLKGLFGREKQKIWYRDYSKGLFDNKTNGSLYREVLKDYIIEN